MTLTTWNTEQALANSARSFTVGVGNSYEQSYILPLMKLCNALTTSGRNVSCIYHKQHRDIKTS